MQSDPLGTPPVEAPPVAVVTGGASGIGRATSELLARRGHRVVVADLSREAADAVVTTLPGDGHLAAGCDVRSEESVNELVRVAQALTGTVDSVVACAGISRIAPSAEVPDADIADLLDIHLLGTVRVLRAAYPHLVRSPRGAAVAMSSMGARLGIPGRLAYCVAKGGIEAMVKTLAVEWAPDAIRVNAVAPGWVRTPNIARLVDDGLLDERPVVDRTPLGRLAEPGEVAEAIAYLLDPASSYVTGHTLVVDGGMSAQGPVRPLPRGSDPAGDPTPRS